ncbi:MAG: sulfatase-like hydrolase/transferase [Planctomycetaceae bacterium]|nr:sulfatase-like hydrolase/transferase [Planctomycetaceae bacterium]
MSSSRKSVLFFALAIGAVSVFIHGAVAENRPSPNVLLIAIDDLRPDLNCYGNSKMVTPRMDQFARSALIFEKAYCQQSVCNPSRTSMLTGLRPETIGVVGNHVHFRTNHPDVVTLPQYFKQQGYRTQAIGKIFHGVFPEGASKTRWDTMGDPESWSAPAVRFGPRYYFTEEGVASAKTAFKKSYPGLGPKGVDWTERLVFGLATEAPSVPDEQLYDGKVAATAITTLRELKDSSEPFFLAVGFTKPHSPFIAPQKYFDLYQDITVADNRDFPKSTPGFAGHSSGEIRRYSDQPNQGEFSPSSQVRLRHAYAACVSFIDTQVGIVLDELDRLGLADNTIVCVFGDHGYHLGEQGLWGKTTNFELDTRVPLIVRTPGMKSRGKKSQALVELVDIYPTLVEAAGLPANPKLEGESFQALLNDASLNTKGFALSQYPRGKVMGYSLRTNSQRLTQWRKPDGTVVATELYDYDESPIEQQNIAGLKQNSKTVNTLNKQLVSAFGLNASPAADMPKGSLFQTGFESLKPGSFSKLKIGGATWRVVTGTAEIDDQHAKSGEQCLHLLGGAETVVEITLPSEIASNSLLSFWAERWTRRAPFEFKIDKWQNGKWSEIFNGGKTIQVGRAFLSNVRVNVKSGGFSKLRIRVSSPERTGILIDDFRISAPQPQRITNVSIVPIAIPALIGRKASPLVKLKVEVEGSVDPISLKQLGGLVFSEPEALKSLQVYYTGSNNTFSPSDELGQPALVGAIETPKDAGSDSLVGNASDSSGIMNGLVEAEVGFRGEQALVEGENFFWLAATVAPNARLGSKIGAKLDPKKTRFSNGSLQKQGGTVQFQSVGVAVRKSGDDGVHTYRIPGLATTNDGTLLAVYDVRRSGGGDLPGDVDVGLSRSVDRGQTWQPMKIIMDMGADPKWNHDGIGDPSILVDRQTGTIWVSATWSHGNRSWRGSGPGLSPAETGQWIMVRSDDDGVSWSKPINITEQVKKPEWCFLLQGPGKGISMADGTLVFPAQYQDPPDLVDRTVHRLPHSSIIYSRDHGKTWSMGTGAADDTTEAQVVELDNGRLMLNCRFNREPARVVMTTENLGGIWKEHPTSRRNLIEPGACMASLINVDRELAWRGIALENDLPLLLYSNPNSLRGRNHITIKASRDNGETWPHQTQLLLDEEPGRGYSCMSMIDAETVGILYEGSQADMTFQSIKLKDILSPPPRQKTANPKFTLSPLRGESLDLNQASPLAVAPVFQSDMVLQANQEIRIWGVAPAMQEIQVEFANHSVRVTANDNGKWKAILPPCVSSFQERQLRVRAGNETVELDRILVGEVWLCAGQSNMQWPVQQSSNGRSAMASSSDEGLRLLNFQSSVGGNAGVYRQEDFDALRSEVFGQGSWEVANAGSVKGFSAVGYYFGKEMRSVLKCPVGLINVASGGTPIESWVDTKFLAGRPNLKKMVTGNWLDNPILDVWCKTRARENLRDGLLGIFEMAQDESGPNHTFKPGFMFDATIAPFQPMSIAGVLWYQGESNAESLGRVKQYDQVFPILVESWRKGFQSSELPFAFVQLPALNRPFWPEFREHQRRSLSRLSNVGMAITMDVGNRSNVHPTSKQPVGKRLAAWAMSHVYSRDGVKSGPLFESCTPAGDSLEIAFSSVGQGLKSADGKRVVHFEIAGEDGVFYPADAEVEHHLVRLSHEKVPQPIDARYAWHPFPEPPVNLVNSAGYPASPFTTQSKF